MAIEICFFCKKSFKRIKMHKCKNTQKEFLASRENKKKISYIDLFCGIGSFHFSFRKLGWECKMSCDISESAKKTYEQNYGLTPMGNIVGIEPSSIEPYDILCAGFPCQAFSQCGKRKGFEDERGNMFLQIMKFIEYHHPPVLILENVPALLSHDHKKTFQRIQNDLEKEGYSLNYKILKCSEYGIPQMRKRLFIIGILKDSPLIPHLDKLLDCSRFKKQSTLSEYLGKNFQRQFAFTIRCGGRHSPIKDRHNWDGYFVDGKEYRLTLQDALRLQGFDSDFQLAGSKQDQWRQLGNTIPTIFTEMIGKNIDLYT